jgi:hypothetical protein
MKAVEDILSQETSSSEDTTINPNPNATITNAPVVSNSTHTLLSGTKVAKITKRSCKDMNKRNTGRRPGRPKGSLNKATIARRRAEAEAIRLFKLSHPDSPASTSASASTNTSYSNNHLFHIIDGRDRFSPANAPIQTLAEALYKPRPTNSTTTSVKALFPKISAPTSHFKANPNAISSVVTPTLPVPTPPSTIMSPISRPDNQLLSIALNMNVNQGMMLKDSSFESHGNSVNRQLHGSPLHLHPPLTSSPHQLSHAQLLQHQHQHQHQRQLPVYPNHDRRFSFIDGSSSLKRMQYMHHPQQHQQHLQPHPLQLQPPLPEPVMMPARIYPPRHYTYTNTRLQGMPTPTQPACMSPSVNTVSSNENADIPK